MASIKSDHWYIDGNNLNISLMNFYAEVIMVPKDNKVSFLVKTVDSNMADTYFPFDTLENAISFTEEVIARQRTNEEVLDYYLNNIEDNSKKLLKTKGNGIIK